MPRCLTQSLHSGIIIKVCFHKRTTCATALSIIFFLCKQRNTISESALIAWVLMTSILPKVFAFHLHLLDCLKENRTPHLIYHLSTTVQTVIFVPRLSINSRELRIINQLPLFLASVLWKSVTEHTRFPHTLALHLKGSPASSTYFFMNLCG